MDENEFENYVAHVAILCGENEFHHIAILLPQGTSG